MTHLREYWLPYLLGVIIIIVILHKILSNKDEEENQFVDFPPATSVLPNIYELSNSNADNLIKYGKQLIDSTAKYFGPDGTIASSANGLSCRNCHRESGTKLYTNNFLAVASTYPKYRERSGKLESVECRVNDCMQRSLNGEPIDTRSREMKAIVAYIKWTGSKINKEEKIDGVGNKELAFLPRAAEPLTGKIIYEAKCKSCHGENGEGMLSFDSLQFLYPSLWGQHSYAVSAGMFRLSKLASFIKYNMPLGATYAEPLLSNEEAWDVAAYINSQPHPKKIFPSDWPILNGKPVDYPFGPYIDGFSEKQHKYGPFDTIQKVKAIAMKK